MRSFLHLSAAIGPLYFFLSKNVVTAEGTMTPSPLIATVIVTSAPSSSPAPTISTVGVAVPSQQPSPAPTVGVEEITIIPSTSPSKELKIATFDFQQRFIRSVSDRLDTTEVAIFEGIIVDYTKKYSNNAELVETVCEVLNQGVTQSRIIDVNEHEHEHEHEHENYHEDKYLRRRQLMTMNLDLEYRITFTSREEDVDSYKDIFIDYMGANLEEFRDIMRDNGLLAVDEVMMPLYIIPPQTAAPSDTPIPTKVSTHRIRQTIYRMTSTVLSGTEEDIFESIVASYTPLYIDANVVDQVETTVEVLDRDLLSNNDPNNNATVAVRMEYKITYETKITVDSGDYGELFQAFMNNETTDQLLQFVVSLESEGIEVVDASEVSLVIIIPTPVPSPKPTSFPTAAPTLFLKEKTFQFRHSFTRPSDAIDWNSTQILAFESIINGFTPRYGHMKGPPVITTTCEITGKKSLASIDMKTESLDADYQISYSSREVDLSNYQYDYKNFMTNDTIRLEFEYLLNEQGMDIISSDQVAIILPVPSAAPTMAASFSPSLSQGPTSSEPVKMTNSFSQKFSRSSKDNTEAKLTVDEVAIFEQIIVDFTPEYGPDSQFVTTECAISNQQVSVRRRNLGTVRNLWQELISRFVQVTGVDPLAAVDLTLTYAITWESTRADLSGYDRKFQAFMNDNNGADVLLEKLNDNDIDVDGVNDVSIIIATELPTASPTLSAKPTRIPSEIPSPIPSVKPSISTMPSSVPSLGDTEGDGSSNTSAVITGAVVVGSAILVAGLCFLWWKKRKRGHDKQDRRGGSQSSQGLAREVIIEGTPASNKIITASSHSTVGAIKQIVAPSSQAESSDVDCSVRCDSNNEDRFSNNGSTAETPSPTKQSEFVSLENNDYSNELTYIQEVPNDSLLSQGSFLSSGFMPSDYGASHLDRPGDVDEFEMYQNVDLELMRTSVGEKLLESDDMMSEALTKALMDDEEIQKLADSLHFGNHEGSMEIESSVLCDTYDWLKRNDRSGYDSRLVRSLFNYECLLFSLFIR